MAFEFKFPDVGEGITEGVLVKWLVKVGDEVKADQPLAEVETDKAIVELPSPHGGKILTLKAEEGAQIHVGQVIVEIDAEAAPSPDTANEDSVGVVGDLSSEVTTIDEAPETQVAASPVQEVMATPAVRQLAKELNVDLNTLSATGAEGRVTEEDVKKAAGSAPAAAPAAPATGMKKVRKYDMWGHVEHHPYQGIRKSIGDHMAKSERTAVHVTHMDDLNAEAMVDLRQKMKLENKDVSYLALIMKAVTRATLEFPTLNATLDDANADLIVKTYYNMGFAVDTDHGLMVPVVKRVDQKTAQDISAEIKSLAEKARTRTIDSMDMQGGTFTITNVGSFGGLYFTPIINHPEVAILGLGRMHDKALVKDGQVTVTHVIPLSLSYDHRVVDGGTAARFVNKIMELLQTPEVLLNADEEVAH